MQYLKCLVTRKGLFAGKSLSFVPGLNVVTGKNGAGKSLLARGLIDGLWREGTVPRLLREDGWDSLHIEIGLGLQSGYRIINSGEKYYKILKDSEHDGGTLYSEYPASRGSEEAVPDVAGSLPEGEMKIFFTTIPKELYSHVALMPAPFDFSDTVLLDYNGIRGILLEDQSHFYRLHCNLASVFNAAGTVDDSHIGSIILHRKTLKDIDRELQIAELRDGRKVKLSKEKETIGQEIAAHRAAIASLQGQKDILEKALESMQRLETLREDYDRMKDEVSTEQEKIKTAKGIKKEIDSKYPHLFDSSAPDSDLDALQKTFNDLRNVNQRLNDLYFTGQEKRRRLKWMLAALDFPIATALALMLARSLSQSGNSFIIPAVIACAAVPANLALVIMYLMAGREKELETLEKEHETLRKRFKDMLHDRSGEIEDFRVSELYGYLMQYFEDSIEYIERKKDLSSIEGSLKEKEYLAEVKARLDAIKKEEKKLMDELDTSFNSITVVDNIEREIGTIEDLIRTVDGEIEFNRNAIAGKEDILSQIESEIQEETTDDERREILVRERGIHDSALQTWNTNHESLCFIKDRLTAAVQRREENSLKKLAAASADYFNYLTGGQYAALIDEEALTRLMREGSVPYEIPTPNLHTLSLSVKLALTDHLSKSGMNLPLLIDEPFQNMDEERSSRLREILGQVSGKRQIILFTHQKDKSSWGNSLEL